MPMAKITILSMLNYRDMFSDMDLPTGINKEYLKNAIILRGGEFGVLYANPDFMHDMGIAWAFKWKRTFQRWIDVLRVNYAPLENYDRLEEEVIDNQANSKTSNNGSGESESFVNTYDDDKYHPEGKQNTHDTNSGESEATGKSNRKLRAHGNIGVTTSQQMLKDEIDVSRFNLYDEIAELYLEEFAIMIY